MRVSGNNQPHPGGCAASSMTRPPEHPPRLILVGGSVRGMAASAVRAGFEVYAADLFADLDLRAIAAATETPRPYPAALPEAVARFPAGVWAYTGALENHPDVIAEISLKRPLAGCGPAAIEAVRDPGSLAAIVAEAGLDRPETRLEPDGLPPDGSWLRKPQLSAGGHGIVPWHGLGGLTDATGNSKVIWQRRIAGRPIAAAYLAAPDGGRLVGASRQLVGRRWCHARPFHYCGSIDLDLDSLPLNLVDSLTRLGRQLAAAGRVVGLVGVDLVVDPQGRPFVIEVNPRPTASMELIERATGLSLAEAHLAACGLGSASIAGGWWRQGTWAKAILFAPRAISFDEAALAAVEAAAGPAHEGWPSLADIPAPPQSIAAGHPICTLFARAAVPHEALARLRRRTARVGKAIARFAAPDPATSC